MSAWNGDELDRVGRAEELAISSQRANGTDRPFVTIWVVRAGDHIYVRSAYGTGNPWYRRALRSGSAASAPEAWTGRSPSHRSARPKATSKKRWMPPTTALF